MSAGLRIGRGLLCEWAARHRSSWTLTSMARQASSSWLMMPCILSLLPTIMAIPSVSSVWGGKDYENKHLRSSAIQIWNEDVCVWCINWVSLPAYEHITDRIHDLYNDEFRPHLLGLVDATDRCHLTVFVSSENLTHGARGYTVGHTENVDLLFLMDITHRCFFLSLRRRFAAVECIRKQWKLPVRLYILVHTDEMCTVTLIMSQVHTLLVYWWYSCPVCQHYNQ